MLQREQKGLTDVIGKPFLLKSGIIVSCFGKNADSIRAKFEKNYYKLKEFCSIAQKLEQKEKDEIIQQFMSSFEKRNVLRYIKYIIKKKELYFEL